MTSPNFNNPSQISGLTDLANSIGLSGLQHQSTQSFLDGRMTDIAGPFGTIADIATGGLGSIVNDIVNFATDGALNNTMDAASYVRSRILPFQIGLGDSQAALQDQVDWAFTQIDGVVSGLDSAWGMITGLGSSINAVKTGINEGWIDGDESEADADVFATMRSIRVQTGGGGFTRLVVTSTNTWTKPTDPVITECVVLLVACGGNGTAGGDTYGGAGGLGGGFIAKAIPVADFDALHITIGTGGAATVVRKNDASGDILAQALNGAPGATATMWGYTASSSAAGNGGAGGTGSSGGVGGDGSVGQATPAIPGGTGGTGGPTVSVFVGGGIGGNGGSVLATTPVPCGGSGAGGGGGGGTGAGLTTVNGGAGGAGGFPGGGGGGGGGGGRAQSTSARGSGGAGGPGAGALALVYYR